MAIKELDLLLGVRDDRAVAFDAETGEELAGYGQLQEAFDEAQERIRELQAKLRKSGERK